MTQPVNVCRYFRWANDTDDGAVWTLHPGGVVTLRVDGEEAESYYNAVNLDDLVESGELEEFSND
jgi:hypothetical protein